MSADDALFHYTSVDGALGILESNDFFASHIRYLNDLSELDHFKGFVRWILDEVIDDLEPHVAPKMISHLRKFVDAVAAAIVGEVEALVDIYTTSFSIPRDQFEWTNGLLSQWRAYGPAGGVVVEVGAKSFVALLEQQQASNLDNNYRFENVIYGDNVERISEMRNDFNARLSEHFEALIGRIIDRRKSFMKKENVYKSTLIALKDDLQVYGELISEISTRAIFFKHQAFKEENEFRVSVERPYYPGAADGDVKFRVRGGIPIPYIMLFNRQNIALPIRRILVGPHRDSNSRAAAFAKVVGRRGYNVVVETSSIPFV
jgi:hypothetical protein